MRAILSAVCALVLWAGESHAQETLVSRPLPEVTEVVHEPVVLSQGDKRWKDARLGKRTIGVIGCLATSLTMGLRERGDTRNPKDIAETINRHRLVTPGGSLYLKSLGIVSPSLIFSGRPRVNALTIVAITQSLLAQNKLLVLKLDGKPQETGFQQHWVYVQKVENGSVIVADPDGGKIGRLEQLYGLRAVRELVAFRG